MLKVRLYDGGDAHALAGIVSRLPDYFTDDVAETVVRDAAAHAAWALVDPEVVVGFVVVERKSPRAAEILWMAVEPERRGRGEGTVLLDHVLDHLAADGVDVVEAKTLDRSAGDDPYRATRAFWERRGFVQVDTVDPLPGWRLGNPAAIYVVSLRSTR